MAEGEWVETCFLALLREDVEVVRVVVGGELRGEGGECAILRNIKASVTECLAMLICFLVSLVRFLPCSSVQISGQAAGRHFCHTG